MTPQERYEYKRKWLADLPVEVMVSHDLKWDAKDWIKQIGVEQHSYEYKEHTAPYMDTWLFENMNEALKFSEKVVGNRVN